jgi:hypothetical protein
MEQQFNAETFDKTVEFKKQVQAGAASQSTLQSAINFGQSVLTQSVPDPADPTKSTSIVGSAVSALFNALGGGSTASSVTGINPVNDPQGLGTVF